MGTIASRNGQRTIESNYYPKPVKRLALLLLLLLLLWSARGHFDPRFSSSIPSQLAPQQHLVRPLQQLNPTPTPLKNWTLTKLANEADAIIIAEHLSISGAAGHLAHGLKVDKWLRLPAKLVGQELPSPEHAILHLPTPVHWDMMGVPYPYPPLDGTLILFVKTCNEHSTIFCEVVGGPVGGFTVREGKVDYAGIARYKGWTLPRMEELINAVLDQPGHSPKELGNLLPDSLSSKHFL